MSNNTISEKPVVHFLDINASVVENYPSALQDIVLNRRFDGMIIRDVLPLSLNQTIAKISTVLKLTLHSRAAKIDFTPIAADPTSSAITKQS